jgi:hypothetical protein
LTSALDGGCVTLREENRLGVFENRALRRISGPKREEVAIDGRLHNEELHNLYTSPNIRVIKSSKMRWKGHVALKRQIRNAYTVLVGKPEGRRTPGRPRCR